MGPTGLCTWEVCWKSLPAFPVVAQNVFNHYNKAVKLTEENLVTGFTELDNLVEKYHPDRIFYISDSPDFCEPTTWFPGIKDRQCSLRSSKNKSKSKKKRTRRKEGRGREKKSKKSNRGKKDRDHKNREFDLPKVIIFRVVRY
jgi:hypothetical protein